MADEVDISTDRILLAAEERAAAIRASLQGEGQDWCEECGVDIPEARRAAMPNAVRCAPCQEVFEAKGRVWRG